MELDPPSFNAIREAVKRSPTFGEKIGEIGCNRYRPQPDDRLVGRNRCAVSCQLNREVRRKIGHVHSRTQHMGKAVRLGKVQRRIEPAQWAQSGFRQIGNAAKSRFLATADDQGGGLGPQRISNAIEQPNTFIFGMRLVATKSARLPSGEDCSKYLQSNAPIRSFL